MNKKEEQDRAIKYVKIRVTNQLRKDFKKCCEINGTDMSKELVKYIFEYVAKNMYKVKEKND